LNPHVNLQQQQRKQRQQEAMCMLAAVSLCVKCGSAVRWTAGRRDVRVGVMQNIELKENAQQASLALPGVA
jgi:hypothetical protein